MSEDDDLSSGYTHKVVVFSSWGRLLRLVGEALEANGVEYASLVVPTAEVRQAELHRFSHDPQCRVMLLLMVRFRRVRPWPMWVW